MPTRTALAPVLLLAALATCTLGACRASSSALADDPRRALEQVEERLLAARSVRCFTKITGEGAMAVELRCEHQLLPDGRARVRVLGAVGGRAGDAVLESDGGRLRLSGAGVGAPQERAATPELFEGLLVVFTRMGWLHDATQIAGGAMPADLDGDARGRIEARDVRFGDEFELNGVPARPLLFDVAVDGRVGAQAVLWVASESALPLMRLQRMQLPQGEVRVTEFYEQLELDGRTEWP